MSLHEMKSMTVEERKGSPEGLHAEVNQAQQKDENDARVLERLGYRQQLNVIERIDVFHLMMLLM